MDFHWVVVLLGTAFVLLLGVVAWRFLTTAAKGITAAARVANEAMTAVRPLTDGMGHVVQGVGNVVDGAGDVVKAFAESLRSKQKERAELAAENAALGAQIEQLKSRHISASDIERQLQVAFFSIKSKYTSFKNESKVIEAGGMLGLDRPTNRQFLSLIDANYTAKIGVDFKKLKFGLKRDSNVVYVFGAHEVQNIGLSDLTLKESFTEVRTIFAKTAVRSSAIEVLLEDADLRKQTAAHRDEVLQEIQNSPLFSSLAEANEKIAIGFFQTLMGGGRYEFVPKTELIDEPLTFEQLCFEINDALNRQMEKLQASKAANTNAVSALDEEIFEVAIQSHLERRASPKLKAVH